MGFYRTKLGRVYPEKADKYVRNPEQSVKERSSYYTSKMVSEESCPRYASFYSGDRCVPSGSMALYDEAD